MENSPCLLSTVKSLVLVALLAAGIYSCDHTTEHHQDPHSDLENVVRKLAGRESCNPAAPPPGGGGGGEGQGDSRAGRPMDMRRVWINLGHALMAGLGCAERHACPGKPTCNQLVDQAVRPDPVNDRHIRHVPQVPGRFSGDLDTYPIMDTHQNNGHSQLTSLRDPDPTDMYKRSAPPRRETSSPSGAAVQQQENAVPQPGQFLLYDDALQGVEGLLQLTHSAEPKSLQGAVHGNKGILHSVASRDYLSHPNYPNHLNHVRGQFLHHQGSNYGDVYPWMPPHPQTAWWLQQDEMFGREGNPVESSSHDQYDETGSGQFMASSHQQNGFQAARSVASSQWNSDDNRQPSDPGNINYPARRVWSKPANGEHPEQGQDRGERDEHNNTSGQNGSKHDENQLSQNGADVPRQQKGHEGKMAPQAKKNDKLDRKGGRSVRRNNRRLSHQARKDRPKRLRRTTSTTEQTTAINVENETQADKLKVREDLHVHNPENETQADKRTVPTNPQVSASPRHSSPGNGADDHHYTDIDNDGSRQSYSSRRPMNTQRQQDRRPLDTLSEDDNPSSGSGLKTTEKNLSVDSTRSELDHRPGPERNSRPGPERGNRPRPGPERDNWPGQDRDNRPGQDRRPGSERDRPLTTVPEATVSYLKKLNGKTSSVQTTLSVTASLPTDTSHPLSRSPSTVADFPNLPEHSFLSAAAAVDDVQQGHSLLQKGVTVQEHPSPQRHSSPPSQPSLQNHPSQPGNPQGHAGPDPFNHSVVAVKLLFAAIGRTPSNCGHVQYFFSNHRAWEDRVCSLVESTRGGGYTVVQQNVFSLEMKLIEALDRWNPENFLRVIPSGQMDNQDFVQRHKCFSVKGLASSVGDRLRRVNTDNCHRELRDFVFRLSSAVVTRLLQGQQHKPSHEACQTDFVSSLFNTFGVQVPGCSNRHLVSVEGLQSLLDAADQNCSHRNNGSNDDAFNTDADDDLAESGSRDLDDHQAQHDVSRGRRSTRISKLTARQLVDIILNNQTDAVNVQQFYQLCPALLHQVLLTPETADQGPHAEMEMPERTEADHTVRSSAIHAYGLGTVAVAVITVCSLLGAVVVKVCGGGGGHYAMAAMLGLAVGNLCGDAVLHLLPEALGLGHTDHDHHSNGADHRDESGVHHLAGGLVIDDVRLKCLALLAVVYLFWLLEILTARYHNMRHGSSDKNTAVGDSRRTSDSSGGTMPVSTLREMSELTMPGQAGDGGSAYEMVSPRCVYNNKPVPTPSGHFQESSHHLVWMIVVGDAIHNLADGLAIGAAFAHNVSMGLSTAMAVVCHEIPHELGDFAVLVSTGMKVKKALLLNLLSALTAFVGLYVGLGLGAHVTHREWIFVIVAGMFLYVSLADLIPELVRYFLHFRNARMFLAQSIGLLSGFAAMFVLVLLEDKLHF